MTTTVTPATPASPAPARPSGLNPWLVIGGFATALLLVAGALSTAGWLGFRTETQHQVYYQHAGVISIDVGSGDITLVRGEPGQVVITRRLHWSYEKPTVEESWDGQNLRVSGGCRFVSLGPSCGVDYTLAVPSTVVVEARTGTGDVTARDLAGELTLTTSTGDVSVTGAAGKLLMHSSTGEVSATGITSGYVDASTSTGDISLRFVEAPQAVAARSSTGDVRISLPDDGGEYRVEADAGTGDVRIGIRQDDQAGRSVTARAGTGDVDIQYA